MNRMKLGTMLLGAAAGGMAVNVFWYARTSAYLKKQHKDFVELLHGSTGEAMGLRLLADSMANIAKNSKTMSKKDKDEIERLNRLAWEKLTSEEKQQLFLDLQEQVASWQENDEEKAA